MATRPFTQAQVDDYIKAAERTCPHCGTDADASDISRDSITQASATGSCADCGREWTEVYTVSNIIANDDIADDEEEGE
jgi:DNA-directed RNA polymerase subunit RPC12/RpoP